MSDTNKVQYDYELNIPLDRGGSKFETVRIKEIPYDVYKAAKPYFKEDMDKAMRILINSVAATEEDKQKGISILDSNNLVPMMSMENQLADLLSDIPGHIKKK